MKSAEKRLSKITTTLSGPRARFYAFAVFFVLVFFTGGGSRDDIQSLVLLRPLAVLFCAYALVVRIPAQWTGRQFPLYILAALMALMLLQLLPLPASVWTQLPERMIFADIADMVGLEQSWRPLTLTPSRTLNSLFALAVPLAATMLYLNLDREGRKKVIPVIIILCVISAIWATFQIVGPASGPLYTYRITNVGIGVGLFANRNHQAIMLVSGIVLLGWYAASRKSNDKQAPLKFYGGLATILIFVPLIFITGSRAALLLMVPALALALYLVNYGRYQMRLTSGGNDSKGKNASWTLSQKLPLLVGIFAIVGIVASSILLSRSLAFDRLFSGGDVEELRFQLLPTLFAMLKDYMPWGSGFGSFEHVYRIHEPQELLRSSYLNQAHNDWLQFPIEGGIPALLIVLVATSWFVKGLWILIKNWRGSSTTCYRSLACIAVILFLLASSIGDYPLRVPSLMAIFTVLVCIFHDGTPSIQQRDINRL